MHNAGDGQVPALRAEKSSSASTGGNLRVARRSAVEQRANCQRQIETLMITAPNHLRTQLLALTTPGCGPPALPYDRTHPRGEPEQAAKIKLRHLARRHVRLTEEITEFDALIQPLVAAINPALLQLHGVRPDITGQLLVTAGENTNRLRFETAFAMLCGVAPIPASSAETTDTDPTTAATGKPTPPSTGSCSADCAGISAPRHTCNAEPPRDSSRRTSSAASNDSPPARTAPS